MLAVELFVVGGDVFVNELAPRPHNSGHWTLDAARTSQFEQQIRAVCGIGLGDTSMTTPAVGDGQPAGRPLAPRRAGLDGRVRRAARSVHLYGKAAARPGRKMGHLTVTGGSADVVAAEALALRDAISRSR